MPSDLLPRCGDVVFHKPSGETWLVAYAEGDHLAWAGWPDGRATLADCEVIRRCTDAEHAEAVAAWRRLQAPDTRRGIVLRLYGASAEETPDAT